MSVQQRFGEGHRILVSGGAGFVPSHLVDALLARGCTVVALDNFVTGSAENVAHLAGEPRFTLIEADVVEGLPAHPETGRSDLTLPGTVPGDGRQVDAEEGLGRTIAFFAK